MLAVNALAGMREKCPRSKGENVLGMPRRFDVVHKIDILGGRWLLFLAREFGVALVALLPNIQASVKLVRSLRGGDRTYGLFERTLI